MENMRNCTPCSCNDDMRSPRMGDRCSNRDCEHWAIGMGYVPWQNLENLYEPAQALRAGTLFPELEKPFMARDMARKGARR